MIIKTKEGQELEIEDTVFEPIKNEIENKVRAEVASKLTELEEVNHGLVGQIKELRKKPKETDPTDIEGEAVDIEAKVEQVLAKRRESEAEANKTNAIDLFKAKHSAFHPDNDPSGIKFAAILAEFNGFNLSGLYSVEEFMGRLNKAKQLVMPETSKDESVNLDPTNPGNDANPRVIKESKLTPQEQAAIKTVGMSEERFLKLKEKDPELVARALNLKVE